MYIYLYVQYIQFLFLKMIFTNELGGQDLGDLEQAICPSLALNCKVG